MKFGIFAMPEHVPWSNWELSFDLDLEKIKLAERLGFDEFWVGGHHSGGYENVPVPEYYIARASAVTSRIRLGTGTVNLPYEDPFLVAERLAFLDQLTHGRLIAGLGQGGFVSDQQLFGTTETAKARFNEAIPVVEALFNATEPMSHHGEFYSFDDRELQVRPLQDPLPIAVAGFTSFDKYELAGRNGYGAMSLFMTSADEPSAGFPTLKTMGQALDRGAIEAGRDPMEARANWRVLREVYVTESREKAIEEISAGVRISYDYLIRHNGAGAILKNEADQSLDSLTVEYLVDKLMIVGSPEDCIEQIVALRDTIGPFGYFVLTDHSWVPSDLWARSKEMFMQYVAPAFKRSEEQLRRRRLVDDSAAEGTGWPTRAWIDRPIVTDVDEAPILTAE